MLSEQLNNKWRGLSQDAINICQELNISGVFDSNISKSKFKNIVNSSCSEANNHQLQDEIRGYKKMSALRDEQTKGNN